MCFLEQNLENIGIAAVSLPILGIVVYLFISSIKRRRASIATSNESNRVSRTSSSSRFTHSDETPMMKKRPIDTSTDDGTVYQGLLSMVETDSERPSVCSGNTSETTGGSSTVENPSCDN